MNDRTEKANAKETSTGLKALVRVAAHYGLPLDSEQLRRQRPFSAEEPDAAILAQIAGRVGFSCKSVRIKAGHLSDLSKVLPAILLLNNGKAVVITEIKTGQGATLAEIDDLQSATPHNISMDEPRLLQIWSGAALLLKRQRGASDENGRVDMGWMLAQLRLESKLFRDLGLASFFMTFLALAPPLSVMVLIDRVVENRSMSTLKVMALMLLILVGFETLFTYLRRRISAYATARIDARLNLYIFDRLLNLPLSFFEQTPTGSTLHKLGQIRYLREFLVTAVYGVLLDGVMLLVLLPVLFYVNWILTIWVLVLATFIIGTYFVYLHPISNAYGKVIAAEIGVGRHLVETLNGIKTVKSLSLDGLKRVQRDSLVAAQILAHRNMDYITNIPQTIAMPAERLMFTGSFIVGAALLLMTDHPEFTIGSVMGFGMLAGRIAGPVGQIVSLLNSYQFAKGALEEVGSVLNAPQEGGRSGTGLRRAIVGEVVFDEVKFKYSPTARYALEGVGFKIPAGYIFGVMGRSGSGKTTVTRLLQGLSNDYEGIIKIDGMDLREIDLDHLRANIGVVPQENFLFSGTIAENIGAAKPRATFDEIVHAAQMAGAEEFIERLPNGYATEIAEGAVNLSGGQRQRLAMARALLVDPPILILDEATSALDAESEAIVNANLMRIAKGRTVIIISHRLSAFAEADAILVLERGKFYDVGTHSELIDRCDIYKTLWYQQNRHLMPGGSHALS